MATSDIIMIQENSNSDFLERRISAVSSGKVIKINASAIPEAMTLASSDISGLDTALSNKIETSQRGVASGVATLDATGKVPASQLPDAVVGGVIYKGTWDASTNTPTIPSASSSNKGFYYVTSISGNTNIDGISDWKLGDWIISNGTAWEKVDNTDAVISVAGKTGNVTLVVSDISSLQGILDSKASTNSPTFTGSVTLPATTNIGSVSSTEVAYLAGVTSGLQTQLNGKQASLGFTAENTANKNQNNGYCGLDNLGKIAVAQLPATVINWASPPATKISTGTAGEISYDNDYLYICVAPNSWKRIPLAIWS